MALFKQITNDNGITSTYHKIIQVTAYNNQVSCMLYSYVSKDYRLLERNADSQFFSFDISTEEEESMGIRQLCYKKIKELEEWSDAEDC